MRISNKYPIALIALAALGTSGPALAHAKLVRSNPAMNAAVAAPKAITLTFDEKIVPAFSSFTVSMPMGSQTMQVPVKTHVDKDGKTLTGVPTGKLTAGSYVVHWTVAAADDGHKMSGDLNFKVR
jgi:methionine-rich copper-binding protein CopC